jgi:hypothetical protein
MTSEQLIETAKEYGRRSATCQHKNHDVAMVDRIRVYQRSLERDNDAIRSELAAAFRSAYQEEASYYIDSRPMSR